jgi:hypothetical protein
MGITPHPAPYPDIVMYEHALAITWRVYLRSNGVPIDITGDEVLAPVLDDRVEVAELGVERLDDVAGTLQLTIDQTVFDAVKCTQRGVCSTLRSSTTPSCKAGW